MNKKELEYAQACMKKRLTDEKEKATEILNLHTATGKKVQRYRRGISQVEKEVHEFLLDAQCDVYRYGWPDFLVKKGDKYLLIETKTKGEKITKIQKDMHNALKTIGLEVIVFRLGEDKEALLNRLVSF
jgi:predicted RecB family nuclease